MHLLKRMVQKLDLYCFKYSLFQTINIFWLLLWRLCKFSSCINPVLDPNFFIRGIKKTQSLRFFYQINCDKILNNSNKTRFRVHTVLFNRYICLIFIIKFVHNYSFQKAQDINMDCIFDLITKYISFLK